MDMQLWMAFVAATVFLLRKVAVASAAGVAFGDLLAMSASLAGLGALVLTSATLFTVIKWVGAAYLVWMGIGMIRSAGASPLGHTDAPALPAGRIFRNAAMVTALNPKSIVFLTFVGLAFFNALAYALLADRLRGTIRKPAVVTGLTRAGGAVLVAMGLATAALRKAA